MDQRNRVDPRKIDRMDRRKDGNDKEKENSKLVQSRMFENTLV